MADAVTLGEGTDMVSCAESQSFPIPEPMPFSNDPDDVSAKEGGQQSMECASTVREEAQGCAHNSSWSEALENDARRRKRHQRVHPDGFAWIKYGEKSLLATGVLREYYKCRDWRSPEKGGTSCKARKIVDRPMLLAPSKNSPQCRKTPATAVAVGPTCTQVVIASHNHPPPAEMDLAVSAGLSGVAPQDPDISCMETDDVKQCLEEGPLRRWPPPRQCHISVHPDDGVGIPAAASFSSSVGRASTLPHTPTDARMLAKYNQALMSGLTPSSTGGQPTSGRRSGTPRGLRGSRAGTGFVPPVQPSVPEEDLARGWSPRQPATSPSTASNPSHADNAWTGFHSGSCSAPDKQGLGFPSKKGIHEGLTLLRPEELHSPSPCPHLPRSVPGHPTQNSLSRHLPGGGNGRERAVPRTLSFVSRTSAADNGCECPHHQNVQPCHGARKRPRASLTCRSRTEPSRRLDEVMVPTEDWLHLPDALDSLGGFSPVPPGGRSEMDEGGDALPGLLSKALSLPAPDDSGHSWQEDSLADLGAATGQLPSPSQDLASVEHCAVDLVGRSSGSGAHWTEGDDLLASTWDEDASLLSSMLGERETEGAHASLFLGADELPSPSVMQTATGPEGEYLTNDIGSQGWGPVGDGEGSSWSDAPAASASGRVDRAVSAVPGAGSEPVCMDLSECGHSTAAPDAGPPLVCGPSGGASGQSVQQIVKLIVAAAEEAQRRKEENRGCAMQASAACGAHAPAPFPRVSSVPCLLSRTLSSGSPLPSPRMTLNTPSFPSQGRASDQPSVGPTVQPGPMSTLALLTILAAASAEQRSMSTGFESRAQHQSHQKAAPNSIDLKQQVVIQLLHTLGRHEQQQSSVGRHEQQQTTVGRHEQQQTTASLLASLAAVDGSHSPSSPNSAASAMLGTVPGMGSRAFGCVPFFGSNTGQHNTRVPSAGAEGIGSLVQALLGMPRSPTTCTTPVSCRTWDGENPTPESGTATNACNGVKGLAANLAAEVVMRLLRSL